MSRNKGTFVFAANFEVKKAEALDPRGWVETKADLINKETWPYDGDTLYLYKGMQVVVADELAVYMLNDVSKALETDYSGWTRKDVETSDVQTIIENYVKTQVDPINTKLTSIENKLTSIFTFKGSKDTLAEIEAVENPNTGDVWHNKENSGEYVYDGTTWEFLGINVDLSSYAKTEDVTSAISSAKEELNTSITGVQTDLQGKIDQKVDKAEGKSLVDDTLIDQIGQNQADIESITATIGTEAEGENPATGLVKEISDLKVEVAKKLDSDAQFVIDTTTDVADLKETTKTLGTTVQRVALAVDNLKVKDVDSTASNGVALTLSESGVVGVEVTPADLTAAVKSNLNLKTDEIKIKAAIGGSEGAPTYAADSTVQEVLAGIDARITANKNSITAAVAGGVTAIEEGSGIVVDATSTTQPKVSVKVVTAKGIDADSNGVFLKISDNSNLKFNDAGNLDLVWLDETGKPEA